MIALSTGCGGSLKSTVRSPSSTTAHMGNSTVALVMADEDGDVRPYCTGVWVTEDEILTANHCVEAVARHLYDVDEETPVDPVGVKIHYIVEKEAVLGEEPTAMHLGHVKAVNEDNDLALIKVELSGVPTHEYADVADELPALGERVLCVGHPRGLYWSYVQGVVSAYRKSMPGMDKGGPFVQVSAPVWFGNSGGGVFDTSGRLVGIASFITKAPNTAFYIHADNIKKFLAEWK